MPSAHQFVHRTGSRRALGLVMCLILLSLLFIGTPSPAHARQNGAGVIVRNIGGGGQDLWLGAFEAPANGDKRYPTWCTHMWRADPQPQHSASLSTLTDSSQWGPAELDATTAQLAWILMEHQGNQEATNRAALAYLIHANLESADPGRDPADSVSRLVSAVRTQIPQVDALARKYVEEARRSAAVRYSPAEVIGDGERKGELRGIGIASASGWVAGRAVTAILEGPAVFTATGSSTWSGSTANEPVSLAWRSTGNGPVNASIVYTDPARTSLTRYTTSPGIQDTVSIGDRPAGEPVERRVAGPSWRVEFDFQPIARSSVGDAKRVVDAPPSDVLTVGADPDYGSGTWMSIGGAPVPVVFEGTAYALGERLPETSANVPEGAKPVGTVRIIARGPGEYSAALDEQVEAGFLTWVWRVDKEAQSHSVDDRGETVSVRDLVHANWSDAFGLPEETSSVPTLLEIDSSLSIRTTKSGDYLVDDLFIKGFPSDHPAFAGGMGFDADAPTLTQRLLFFPEGLEVLDENRDRAQVVASVEVPARNGFHPSVGSTDFKVDGGPGTYVFVSSFTGDARVRPFESSVEDPSEQFRVDKPDEQPKLSTTATDAADGDKELAPAGTARIRDRVCYEGLEGGATYLLEGALMDRDSGEAVLDGAGSPVTGASEFTAEAAQGCVDVEFEVEGARLAGRTSVVFERLSRDGALIAAHADLDDEGQSVRTGPAPKISTTARDGAEDDSSIPAGPGARILDEVCYEGLTPGVRYSLSGVLMDRLLNSPLLEGEARVTGELEFTPDEPKGCVDVEFTLNTTALAGRELVVFEELSSDEGLVAVHADIDDEGQTVRVDAPPPSAEGPAPGLADTGGDASAVMGVALLLLMLGIPVRIAVRARG